MKLSQALRDLRASLVRVAGECSLPESERIATFLLGISRSELYLCGDTELSPGLLRSIADVVNRRLTGEPLPYILGSAYFFDQEIAVTRDVLIPRPDTETLIEAVLAGERPEPLRFLDFGTGSGCITAVLAGRNRRWRAVALDASLPALRIARRNCGGGVGFICGRGTAAIRESGFDFIVANPPYIPTPVIPTLDRSVRDFEPAIALDGGADGLAFYRCLADAAGTLLKPGGRIYLEIGYDQGEAVAGILTARGGENIRIVKDLGGRDRVVRGKLPLVRQAC
jgi:release factor glutamine methyltransferase